MLTDHVTTALAALGQPQEGAALEALCAALDAHGGVQGLIAALGAQLTDVNESVRERGMQLLAQVLWKLVEGDSSGLPAPVLLHLVDFLSDRLGDYVAIGPVLHGLSALTRARLPDGAALKVATTLLERCDVRSLAQSKRQAAMQLASDLVSRHWPSLTRSGCHLLLATVRALDGEKDPRNLLQYFQLLQALCEQCEASQVGGLDEALGEVFESLTCYFPITFTPPPHDPYQITSQHLLQVMLRTLRATRRFAPLAIQFFADKLRDVTSAASGTNEQEDHATRLQVLQSLSMLSPAYGAPCLSALSAQIGESLADVFAIDLPVNALGGFASASSVQGSEDTALGQALRVTLTSLAAVADGSSAADATDATDNGETPTLVERIVAPTVARCLSAPPQGPGVAVGTKTLLATHQKAARVCVVVLHQAVPVLLRRAAEENGAITDRADALGILHSLVLSACKLMAGASEAAPMDTGPGAVAEQGGAGGAPTAETAAAIRAELLLHRQAILMASTQAIASNLASKDGVAMRCVAAKLLCLALGPLAATSELELPAVEAALAALSSTLLAAQPSARALLLEVSGRVASLRASYPYLRGSFDVLVRAPLLEKFGSAKGAVDDAALMLPAVLAEVCWSGEGSATASATAGDAEEDAWSEGLQALIASSREAMAKVLVAEDAAAVHQLMPPCEACLEALSRLFDKLSAHGSSTHEWALDVLSELFQAWLHAARDPREQPGLFALVHAAEPLWAAACTLNCGTDSLLSRVLPHLLPSAAVEPAGGALSSPLLSPTTAQGRLLPLLRWALVHTPTKAASLGPSVLSSLAQACHGAAAAAVIGHKAADGTAHGDVAHGGEEQQTLLRCMCAAYNKWADDSALKEALSATHSLATQGDLIGLRVWTWLGRSVVCRGGRYTQLVPQQLVELITAPPPSLSPTLHSSWLTICIDGIGQIMSPPAPDLLKESGAKLAPLLTQRLYIAMVPVLRTAFERADLTGATHEALSDALALCILHAPRPAIVAQPAASVPHLLSWLQRTLSRRAPASAMPGGVASAAVPATGGGQGPVRLELLPRVLQIVTELISELDEADAAPLVELIPPLITLLAGDVASPVPLQLEVVSSAIGCLNAARLLPWSLVSVHKRKVVQVLQATLDHKKRRIRSAAQDCINHWHLLRTPV